MLLLLMELCRSSFDMSNNSMNYWTEISHEIDLDNIFEDIKEEIGYKESDQKTGIQKLMYLEHYDKFRILKQDLNQLNDMRRAELITLKNKYDIQAWYIKYEQLLFDLVITSGIKDLSNESSDSSHLYLKTEIKNDDKIFHSTFNQKYFFNITKEKIHFAYTFSELKKRFEIIQKLMLKRVMTIISNLHNIYGLYKSELSKISKNSLSGLNDSVLADLILNNCSKKLIGSTMESATGSSIKKKKKSSSGSKKNTTSFESTPSDSDKNFEKLVESKINEFLISNELKNDKAVPQETKLKLQNIISRYDNILKNMKNDIKVSGKEINKKMQEKGSTKKITGNKTDKNITDKTSHQTMKNLTYSQEDIEISNVKDNMSLILAQIVSLNTFIEVLKISSASISAKLDHYKKSTVKQYNLELQTIKALDNINGELDSFEHENYHFKIEDARVFLVNSLKNNLLNRSIKNHYLEYDNQLIEKEEEFNKIKKRIYGIFYVGYFEYLGSFLEDYNRSAIKSNIVNESTADSKIDYNAIIHDYKLLAKKLTEKQKPKKRIF